MAARHPPAILAWLTWLFIFCSWAIMLGAMGSLQKNCGSSGASEIGNTVHYMAPVSCDKMYRYAWWTTWYQFAMVILVPILLFLGLVHKFRLGLIGLLIPIIMLLMMTTNNFWMLWNIAFASDASDELDASDVSGVKVPGGLASRAKTMFAGALIGAIADYVLLLLVGVHDEAATYT